MPIDDLAPLPTWATGVVTEAWDGYAASTGRRPAPLPPPGEDEGPFTGPIPKVAVKGVTIPRVRKAPSDGDPVVIVDNVHLVYKVLGAKHKSDAMARLRGNRTKQEKRELKSVHAVRGVSLIARRGEAIGLIGSNGSGKSTLLQLIAGVLPPTAGKVYCNAQPTLLGINAALMNGLTGERNVVLGCLAMGMKPDEIEDRYEQVVDFSGIGDFIDLPMRAYSSGMRARLKFAIGTATEPKVLLIDEALSAGDKEFKERSKERIEKLREQAGVVFLVHHSMNTIRQMCTRAIWLQQGQIVMDGHVDDVANAYNTLIGS